MTQMPRSLVESGFSTPEAVEAEVQEPEQQEVVEETTQQAEEPKPEAKTTRRKTEAK